ncbi:MAG: adenosylcobinamide amidohydrolase [Deltaproteobacteria bacterium]|nr:adenosylcobinamide amidohydrolase [Deltaproteobacteria bacterium]
MMLLLLHNTLSAVYGDNAVECDLNHLSATCLMPAVTSQTAVVSWEDRWLVVRFSVPHRMLSWAIVGGGFRTATAVAWRQVTDAELSIEVEPRALLTEALERADLSGAVGLLTSSSLAHAVTTSGDVEDLHVQCLATIGLSNALRVGDPAGAEGVHVGTINVCVWLSRALTDEALVEAQALCTEARTLAMLQANVPSIVSGLPATGTGTDCQVVAAPVDGKPLSFVGKHTAAGHLIGAVVTQAISTGVARWIAENGDPRRT